MTLPTPRAAPRGRLRLPIILVQILRGSRSPGAAGAAPPSDAARAASRHAFHPAPVGAPRHARA